MTSIESRCGINYWAAARCNEGWFSAPAIPVPAVDRRWPRGQIASEDDPLALTLGEPLLGEIIDAPIHRLTGLTIMSMAGD
jgi:hypothetical protein